VHPDDGEVVNGAPFGLIPSHSPDEARRLGRYALDNSEHVDVLVARQIATVAGELVVFYAYGEREYDLIATTRVGGRPKDAEEIRLLMALEEERRAAKS
jgi:hypothetical protein